MLACEIERDVVGIGHRVKTGGPLKQPPNALEVLVDDAVDEGCVVVVVNQIDRIGRDCILVSSCCLLTHYNNKFVPERRVSIMSSRPCMQA